VWSLVAAISQSVGLPITTAVTCPTTRLHPAVVAHAAATSAILCEGRFSLGVGTGEALNEHILGDAWPRADVRLEMLEEAIEIVRLLFGGGTHSYRGRHYAMSRARLYDLPAEPPPILVSGFGPKSTRVAAKVGEGYCTVMPDRELIALYRAAGGSGPVQAGTKVCFDAIEAEARRTAHRLWPIERLPGELAQVLPTPAHFEQASELVTEEMVAEVIPCGPDVERHVSALQRFAAVGVDELYVQQVGPNQDGFFDTWAPAILPRFGQGTRSS